MFCIDASILISAARGTEVSSSSSRTFLDFVRKERVTVFLPEIACVEVASGLLRATKKADFAVEFSRTLKLIPNFSFVAIDSRLADSAVGVIQKTGLRAADSIYVALSLDYGLTLITLDKEQISKAQKMINVKSPEKFLTQQ